MWAVIVVGWVVGGLALVATDRTEGFGEGVTASLVELSAYSWQFPVFQINNRRTDCSAVVLRPRKRGFPSQRN